VTTGRDELIQLIEDLPDEDIDKFVTALRELSPADAATLLRLATSLAHEDHHAHQVWALEVMDDDKADWSRRYSHAATTPRVRWPRLGPAALGTAVLLGWIVSMTGILPLAMVGAALGLFLGDRLDQHTVAAADA